jgi:oligopeptide/dipeptide ABC transporter ATP-binding protein
MIFQEPMSSLNPVHTIGAQIMEAIRVHERVSRREARTRAISMLKKVGIPAPEERIDSYPHQLSGGMRQRVMIAIALCLSPKLLIADEPTTALDVTIQAQILDLLEGLREELSMGVLLITHDLGIVAQSAQEVVVMYAGRVVERADTKALFERPQHPYTRGLMSCVPTYGDNISQRRLPTIPGVVPDLLELPKGCRFQSRCDRVSDACRQAEPELSQVGPTHEVACFAVVSDNEASASPEGGLAL